VVGREFLTIVAVGEENALFHEVLEWHIRRVAAVAMEHGEAGFRLELDVVEEGLERHAVPRVVVLAPGRHAVDVVEVGALAEGVELLPVVALLFFDEAPDVELPGVFAQPRDAAVMEDGPPARQMLSGREAELAVGA
jgi:hypothetical protein